MGANASKDLPPDQDILAALNGPDAGAITNKFSDLLLDPIVKRKFDELYLLVQHNSMNDMNHLTRAVAESQREKLPVLLQLSKIYSSMLTQVQTMMPELKTDEERFQFLADDGNLVKFFYWQSGSGSPSIATMLTGQESPDILRSMQSFVGDLRIRDAKLRYFQFKYAQSMLFQAAFTQTMWTLASAFVASTQTFHRARETAFGSVFKQMSAIVQKYTGADDVRLEDVDQLDKLTKKLTDVKNLAVVRDRLDGKKLTSIKDLLQDLINLDSEIVRDPSKLLPVPPGLMSGVEVDGRGGHQVVPFKPTDYVKFNLDEPVPRQDETPEEFKRRQDKHKRLSTFLDQAWDVPENKELIEGIVQSLRESSDYKDRRDKKKNNNNKDGNRPRRKSGKGRKPRHGRGRYRPYYSRRT